MDVDFSHNPTTWLAFTAPVRRADLSIGSRYITGVNVVNGSMGMGDDVILRLYVRTHRNGHVFYIRDFGTAFQNVINAQVLEDH
ncbi:MAG: hypothetical protein IPP46_06150 [Bacteroidetes bacterium]|nr:hypothetical protein [Bacteroidota bacterium]